MKNTPALTDADINELDELLAAVPEPYETVDAVILDGYLTGVLVQPVVLTPEQWLPPIFGTEGMPEPGIPGWTQAQHDKLMAAVLAANEVWNRRVGTGDLNRWLQEAMSRHAPPASRGRRIKIRYMTQPKARPPFFVLFGNQLDALPTSYERYLINGLRETFGLYGVPIRISKKGGKNPFHDPTKRKIR